MPLCTSADGPDLAPGMYPLGPHVPPLACPDIPADWEFENVSHCTAVAADVDRARKASLQLPSPAELQQHVARAVRPDAKDLGMVGAW